MGKAKEKIGFSEKAEEEFLKNEKALKKTALSLIAKTKEKNSSLVTTDKNGKIKKIPAKDL